MSTITPDFQKYMTLVGCPYCHEEAATEITESPRVVICNKCGLYRFYPRMNRDGQVAYLKQINDELDLTHFENLLDQQEFNPDEADELKGNFPDMSSESHILDVGTGEGLFMASLRHSGVLPVTGLEPMGKLSELGNRAGLDIHVGRFENGSMPPDLAGRVFDLICFRESIYYLTDLRETFDLLRRVLRPGGGLYIKCHVPTSIFYWKNKDYSTRYGPSVSGMPTLKAMIRILVSEGYEIIKKGYYPTRVLYTLGSPIAQSLLGIAVDRLVLSPIVHSIGKADRMFILARKL